jgi:uncharacterized OsmC-like protein
MTTFIDMPESPYETAAAMIAELTDSEVTIPARCELLSATTVTVEFGTRNLSADEPRMLGGRGDAPTPGQYLLAALGSSAAINFRYWSDRLGVRFDRLRVEISGRLDLRGFIGLGEGVRPGFTEVRLTVNVSGSESPDRYEDLCRAVERLCPVLDSLLNPVAVTTILETAGDMSATEQ